MRKFGFLSGLLLMAGTSLMHAQITASIKINEVQTINTQGLIDEYGHLNAWVEIANVSHSTYDIRGMFLTTDRSVLDKSMSAPERMRRMSIIPSGDPRTTLTGRQHLVFFCNSKPAEGTMHLTVSVNPETPVWVGLYDGNGVDLIDSVTVPVLAAGQSYARVKDGAARWDVKPAEAVTPGISNYISVSESKIAKLKREDPHGYGITVLSMGVVFFCLALLWIFFTLFGMVMRHMETARKVANTQPIKPITKTVEKTAEIGHKTGVILKDGLNTKGIDKEVYLAVIGLALKQYEDDVHDVESGIITIKSKDTGWDDEYSQMTQFHDPVVPTTHSAPQIPTTPKNLL